jgi:hypothetical protein
LIYALIGGIKTEIPKAGQIDHLSARIRLRIEHSSYCPFEMQTELM